MSGQKYYQDGEKSYEGGYGKFYYNKTLGSGSSNPQDINWMSNINLSRTDRTKTMYVNPVGYSIPSLPIDVLLNKSDLLLLVGCINYEQPNNYSLPTIEEPLFRNSGCTYYVNGDLLSKNIDIIVLTNGNVLDIDLVNEGGIVSSIDNKNIFYYSIEDNDIPMHPAGNNPQSNLTYQDYPNLSSRPIYTYIGSELLDKSYTRATGLFDSITYNNNLEVTNIDITNGGILFTENSDYSKNNNLVAVKIKASLSSLENAGTASRIKIVTAVYDAREAGGVSAEYNECKVIYIEFRLNSEGLSITGDDTSINFDEQGAINGDHEVETSITSTVPWTIGETNTGSNE